MSTRLFEDKEHATSYQKFRFEPSREIIDIILSFLDERLLRPRGFAVDVGCGTGQSTRILSPHFEKVLGIDISDAQIEEAKKGPGSPNVTYSACPAEEMLVADASVDLLTASAAVHWFNTDKFLKEVDRILKPCGCLAFFSYTPTMEIHYRDRWEPMTQVYSEVENILAQYQHERILHVSSGYKEIFDAIPYTDKRRIERFVTRVQIPLSRLLGFIQTLAMFQTYLRTEPDKAKETIRTAEQRFLRIMETSSSDTEIEVWLQNVLVLASKPQ
ncbi:putative methyltransferase [Mantella aurantiaca]